MYFKTKIINTKTITILASKRSQNKCLKNRESKLKTIINKITTEIIYLLVRSIIISPLLTKYCNLFFTFFQQVLIFHQIFCYCYSD